MAHPNSLCRISGCLTFAPPRVYDLGHGEPGMPEPREILSSWKEISAYLKRTTRTCQRLEIEMGLPVHRLDGSPKARVFAYPDEIDAWLADKAHERARERGGGRRIRILYAAAALIVIAAGVVLVRVAARRGPAREPGSAADARSVAVLPFVDLSPGPASEAVADGLADSIINTLGRVPEIRVPGRTSSFWFKGRNVDIREIGRKLSVRTVLEGSIQIVGEDLRVAVQLVNAEDGFRIWAKRYDRKTRDILDVEDEIAMAVLEQLKVRLLAGQERLLRKRPTEDTEAYGLYLKGRYVLGRPAPDAPRRALEFFGAALERDPGFALAHSGVAWAYVNWANQLAAPPLETFPKAKAALERALALDPGLPEAYAMDAAVKFWFDWDWKGAERSFRRALELRPGDSLTRGWYSWFLVSRRRFAEARTEADRAIALDPLMPLFYAHSMSIRVISGRCVEALAEFDRALRIEPNFGYGYVWAGSAYMRMGRLDEARKMLEKSLPLPRSPGSAEAALVACYARKGDRQAAEEMLEKLLEDYKKGFISPAYLAWAYAAVGRLDEGFEWLAAAERYRDAQMPFIHVYAEYLAPEAVRDPRFAAFADRLGLPR